MEELWNQWGEDSAAGKLKTWNLPCEISSAKKAKGQLALPRHFLKRKSSVLDTASWKDLPYSDFSPSSYKRGTFFRHLCDETTVVTELVFVYWLSVRKKIKILEWLGLGSQLWFELVHIAWTWCFLIKVCPNGLSIFYAPITTFYDCILHIYHRETQELKKNFVTLTYCIQNTDSSSSVYKKVQIFPYLEIIHGFLGYKRHSLQWTILVIPIPQYFLVVKN